MTGDRLHRLAERGIEEVRRFVLMFLYLWICFGLYVLNEKVILGTRGIDFASQGFALINAAILAKVMLIAEDLKLGRLFDDKPLVFPIIHKSCVFAVVFIVFHALEEIVVGWIGGKSAAASVPHVGGGGWIGVVLVWAILTVSLLPFFALREIDRLLGKGWIWNKMFRRREA